MDAPDLWIRRFHPSSDAGTRLVCLPHAGGSASFYFPVSQALAPTIDVLAIQYPGRQDRRAEPVVTSIAELADHVVDALVGWTDRRLALFGHSMGSLVAFEVANRLLARGVEVSELFVSGRRAPHLHRDEDVHRRSDDRIIAELKVLNGTEQDLLGDEDVQRMILPAVRGDYQAVETYRHEPGPRLTVPIHAFVGDSDPRVEVAEVREWARHTSGSFTLRTFEGGHFYLTRHQNSVIAAIHDQLEPIRST